MTYNTVRDLLIIPEYGRHVQQTIDYCKSLENKKERTKIAYEIIDVMGVLQPHLRDVPDFQHKLWDQLFIMSNFDLDVDSPYPFPTKEKIFEKPNRMYYPHQKYKYKYYGKHILNMIEAIKNCNDDEEKKYDLMLTIANHMKKMYLKWNKDDVEDIIIIRHLEELSGGELKLKPNESLTKVKFQNIGNNKKFIKKKPYIKK